MDASAELTVALSPRRDWAIAVVTVCTLLCVIDLLARQLAASAPLRGAGDPLWPTRVAAVQFNDADKLIRQAADGHNLQLELDPKSMANPVTQGMLTLLYFRSVYAVFPHRVFVGADDQVINNGPQLAEAAAAPNLDWMRAHDVKNILHLGVDGDGSLVIGVRPVH